MLIPKRKRFLGGVRISCEESGTPSTIISVCDAAVGVTDLGVMFLRYGIWRSCNLITEQVVFRHSILAAQIFYPVNFVVAWQSASALNFFLFHRPINDSPNQTKGVSKPRSRNHTLPFMAIVLEWLGCKNSHRDKNNSRNLLGFYNMTDDPDEGPNIESVLVGDIRIILAFFTKFFLQHHVQCINKRHTHYSHLFIPSTVNTETKLSRL